MSRGAGSDIASGRPGTSSKSPKKGGGGLGFRARRGGGGATHKKDRKTFILGLQALIGPEAQNLQQQSEAFIQGPKTLKNVNLQTRLQGFGAECFLVQSTAI